MFRIIRYNSGFERSIKPLYVFLKRFLAKQFAKSQHSLLILERSFFVLFNCLETSRRENISLFSMTFFFLETFVVPTNIYEITLEMRAEMHVFTSACEMFVTVTLKL